MNADRSEGMVRWLSAGSGFLVVAASIGSFAHIRDAMGVFGQSGAFAWLAAGVIEFGGILGIGMLSQSSRVRGSRASGIAVVVACQGISLWANQAMVASSYDPGQSVVSARVAGCVFPAVVVLGLVMEIVLARHRERLAADAVSEKAAADLVEREARRRAEQARQAAEAKAEAERAREEHAAATQAETRQEHPQPDTTEHAEPAPAPRPRATAARARQQRPAPLDVDAAVKAAIDAGVDVDKQGWYTRLAETHGGSRTWWKDRVAPRVRETRGPVAQIRRIG